MLHHALAAADRKDVVAAADDPCPAVARNPQPALVPRRRLLATLATPMLLLTTPAVSEAQETSLATLLTSEIEVIFWNLDGVRNLYGLPHLHRSPRLDQAAFAHAQDLARTGVLAHTWSDGTDCFTRIRGYYPFDTWLGENLAQGYSSGRAVLDAWRTSPGHNANLLNPAFHAVGLACVAQSDDPAGWFWVADFGGVAE